MKTHYLTKKFIFHVIHLCRLHKPIGSLLLLWPTLWALWIAAKGVPSVRNLIVFILGVLIMRSAGCIINDIADRDFDGYVERTKLRPLATKNMNVKEALCVFISLLFCSFMLVLFTNVLTIKLAFIGCMITVLYPFAKRYTHFPQVIIGLAFGWSIPMSFAAEVETLLPVTWLLLLANIFWGIAYDTQYAMVDRDDDLKIGIKSTAIFFGKYDNLMIGICQIIAILLLLFVALIMHLSIAFYLSVVLCLCTFIYQQILTKDKQRENCFQAFMNNNYSGAIIFLGIVISYL